MSSSSNQKKNNNNNDQIMIPSSSSSPINQAPDHVAIPIPGDCGDNDEAEEDQNQQQQQQQQQLISSDNNDRIRNRRLRRQQQQHKKAMNRGVYDVPDVGGLSTMDADRSAHPLKRSSNTSSTSTTSTAIGGKTTSTGVQHNNRNHAKNQNKKEKTGHDDDVAAGTSSGDRVARHGNNNNNNNRHAKDALHRQSSSPHQDRYESGLLHRGLRDAGRWAYGTVMVELWVLNEERTLLFRPPGGYWFDPIYHANICTDVATCPICRLTDTHRPDSVPPLPLCPGEGLPGILWSEIGGRHDHYHHRRISSMASGSRKGGNIFAPGGGSRKGGTVFAPGGGSRRGANVFVAGSNANNNHNSNNSSPSASRKGGKIFAPSASRRDFSALANHTNDSNPSGTRIGGNIFSHLSNDGTTSRTRTRQTSAFGGDTETLTRIFADGDAESNNNSPLVVTMPGKRVAWREIQAIADDPDQPWNARLQLLATLDLGWVAAVDFHMHGRDGIVIYMARQDVDQMRLQSAVNEEYLVAASSLAGAAFALRGPRREAIKERQVELTDVFRRVRMKILTIQRMPNMTFAQHIQQQSQMQLPQQEKYEILSSGFCFAFPGYLGGQWQKLTNRVLRTIRKSCGGGVQPPPSMSWNQALLTFVGVFGTLVIVTRFNVYINDRHGLDYRIALGPFGALMTLLYGLTAAPASQPRNALLGQCLALTIAIIVGYAENMSIWMRQSLATALAVSSMVKLGLTHPPAGASALIFAGGNYSWGNMLFFLIGNLIAIAAATLINNWSDKRQYPSYWGIPYVEHVVGALKIKEGLRAKQQAEKDAI